MLRNEIRKTIRQTLLTLSFGLLLPVVYWINENRLAENKPFAEYLEAGAMLMVTALIANLSYSMFSTEDSDSAFEYLKTLPLTKWKLAGLKILPRFFVSFLLLMGFNVFVSPSAMPVKDGVALTLYELPILVLSLSSGFFLGIANRKNAVLITLFLIPVFYLLMVVPLATETIGTVTCANKFLSWCLDMLIGFLPLAAVLSVYRKWDCSSMQLRTRAMMKKLLLPTSLILVITLLTFNSISKG